MRFNLLRIYWIISILSIPFMLLIYSLINQVTPNADKNLQAREIETPIKLWLNGYLGCFFSFNYLGNINWFLLVLLPFYLLYKKSSAQQIISYALNKSLLLFFIMSFVLIALKGFFNYRYQFTLLPFLVFFVFYFHWLITSSEETGNRWRIPFAIFLFILVLFNFSYQMFGKRFNEKLRKTLNISIIKDYNNSTNYEEDYKFDLEKAYHANNLLNFINNLNTKHFFLVNNLPDFYYQTQKKGYYYWCGDDIYYSENGLRTLFTNSNIKNIKMTLLKQMKCKYIYTYRIYFNYNKVFDEFILRSCKLIAYDDDYRMLFEIIE